MLELRSFSFKNTLSDASTLYSLTHASMTDAAVFKGNAFRTILHVPYSAADPVVSLHEMPNYISPFSSDVFTLFSTQLFYLPVKYARTSPMRAATIPVLLKFSVNRFRQLYLA